MDHIHWWPAILAANNCRKLHSSQCWIRFRSTVHSTSHHSTTWWSDVWGKRQGLELRAELFIPPVKTVSPGGQVESFVTKRGGAVSSIPPINTSSGKRQGLELRPKPSIPPINQVLRGGQMERLWQKRRGLELRAKPVIPPVNTASPGGQRESFKIIIIDNFCIALFSGVPKLTGLYNILQYFLSFTNIIHIVMTTNNV